MYGCMYDLYVGMRFLVYTLAIHGVSIMSKPQTTDHLFKTEENDWTLNFQACLHEVRILMILLNIKSHQFPQSELGINIKKWSMFIRQNILYATQMLAVENFPPSNGCCL